MKNILLKGFLCIASLGMMFSPIGSILKTNPTEELHAAYAEYKGDYGYYVIEGFDKLGKSDWDYGNISYIRLARGEAIELLDVKDVVSSNPKVCPVQKYTCAKDYNGGYIWMLGENKKNAITTPGTSTLTITRKNGEKFKVKVKVPENHFYMYTNLLYYKKGVSSTASFRIPSIYNNETDYKKNVKVRVLDEGMAKINKTINHIYVTATGKHLGTAKTDYFASTLLEVKVNGLVYYFPIEFYNDPSISLKDLKKGKHDAFMTSFSTTENHKEYIFGKDKKCWKQSCADLSFDEMNMDGDPDYGVYYLRPDNYTGTGIKKD